VGELNNNIPSAATAAELDQILVSLISRFIEAMPGKLDSEIEAAQRLLCQYLGADQSSIWQIQADNMLVLTHLYRPFGGPEPPRVADAAIMFPWVGSRILRGEIVAVPQTQCLPAEAQRDSQTWAHFRVRSTCAIPMSAGGQSVFGALSFDNTETERDWPAEILPRLKVVADVFAGALVRRRADEALRASEERLAMAADAADAGLWTLNVDTGQLWLTEKAREVSGLEPGAVHDLSSFLVSVHPDDATAVRAAIARATENGGQSRVEYRRTRQDGVERWLASHGRMLQGTRLITGVTIDITDQKSTHEALRQSNEELQRLRELLQQENLYLREQSGLVDPYGAIVGESEALKRVLADVSRVAKTGSTVLISGETGTGKELVAQAIHDRSDRRHRPMVTINCAALPPSLMESELFGRDRGAYTGAMTQQKGRFESADGSTIFLDEIGELPMELQAKLLRVLQEGKFERLGSSQTRTVNVRLIAATNRDLATMVRENRFRADLYYRLNVFPMTIPPLRERRDDIPLLVRVFVRHFSEQMGKQIDTIPRETMAKLTAYAWPGNVRELRNLVERAVILTDGRALRIDGPQGMESPDAAVPQTLEEVQRQHIVATLERTGWRISGASGAAQYLGMNPTTLHSMMKRLGIRRPGVASVVANAN